ncbi:hypothetical protein MN608_01691 [Microdochium nivale]|nr:hypothetical protein MN608_01691 [Microdochium nivale]
MTKGTEPSSSSTASEHAQTADTLRYALLTGSLAINYPKPVPTKKPHCSADDKFVAVMGVTKSRKSSFISALTGEDPSKVFTFVFNPPNHPPRRVYLIDTPGFDDMLPGSTRSDTEELKDIAFFLAQTYGRAIRLAGIIYLHRITDMRISGSALKNLAMFN